MITDILNDKIKIEVSDTGHITFISRRDGKICNVTLHPSDARKLIVFLVDNDIGFYEAHADLKHRIHDVLHGRLIEYTERGYV